MNGSIIIRHGYTRFTYPADRYDRRVVLGIYRAERARQKRHPRLYPFGTPGCRREARHVAAHMLLVLLHDSGRITMEEGAS